jgi:xylan 1,4-beta-xylosidase
MFSQMGAQRIAATSDGAQDLDTMMKAGVREKPDVAALASRDGRRVTIMAWHYHDDDVQGPDADVTLTLDGLQAHPAGAKPGTNGGIAKGKAKLRHFRIDTTHSNAYTVWKTQGSPATPTPAQYKALEAGSALATLQGSPATVEVKDGKATLPITLPRQAVSLVVLEW